MNGNDLEVTTGSNYDFWVDGVKFNKTVLQAVTISNDNTMHYVYFDTAGVIQVSTAIWDISAGGKAFVAMVYRYSVGPTYALFDERHTHDRDKEWHEWAHDTVGCRWQDGLVGTFTTTTLSVTQGTIHDEDLDFDTGGTKTACRRWFRHTGAAAMAFDSNKTTPYVLNGANLQYDNAGTLTDCAANRYVCSYVYCTNDQDYPIAVLIGQAQHVNLADAQNDTLPLFPGWPAAEFKLLYRLIYRNTGAPPTYVEAADYRSVTTGPPVTAVSAVHNNLTGRDATECHPVTAISGVENWKRLLMLGGM